MICFSSGVFVLLGIIFGSMYHLRMSILLLLVGLFFSCTFQKKEENEGYSKKIDSLLTELRVLDDSLNTLKIQKIQRINEKFREFYDTAQVRDTQERRVHLYEESQNILRWYGNVNREINYSRSHLRALKNEFESEDIPDSTKQKRLEEERQIVTSIKKRFDQEYASLKKKMEALLNRHSIHE